MASVKIKDNIYWVGAIDFNIRNFHGYKTPDGTSYNAYLVIDEKITLIDSVKEAFSQDLIDNISEIIDPKKIDVIICNHVEPDHSGAIQEVVKLNPNVEIYTSANGKKGLMAYYDAADWNYHVVGTGDQLNTGKYTFNFVMTPLIHWPDNMVSYLEEEEILFSNDAFGQHYASNKRYASEVGVAKALEKAKDYYANIVLPYDVQVKKALKDLGPLKISLIAPSHGLMWDGETIPPMLDKYVDWSDNKCDEKKAMVIYDTMWGATETIAKKIVKDFNAKGIEAELIDLKYTHVSEAMDKLMEAKYICVGSSTLNRSIMPTVASFLAYMRGLGPKNRIGLAFGSYGWSGESVKIIEETLETCKFEMLDTIKVQYKDFSKLYEKSIL